jgi:hypothetical protein
MLCNTPQPCEKLVVAWAWMGLGFVERENPGKTAVWERAISVPTCRRPVGERALCTNNQQTSNTKRPEVRPLCFPLSPFTHPGITERGGHCGIGF